MNTTSTQLSRQDRRWALYALGMMLSAGLVLQRSIWNEDGWDLKLGLQIVIIGLPVIWFISVREQFSVIGAYFGLAVGLLAVGCGVFYTLNADFATKTASAERSARIILMFAYATASFIMGLCAFKREPSRRRA